MQDKQTLYRAWYFIQEGKPDTAFEILKEVETDPFLIANRATSLLLLHRLEESLSDYKRICDLSPDSDDGPIRAGVVSWWLRRPNDAVRFWQLGLNAKQTDAAGGIEAPSLLYFASIILMNANMEKEALSLLRKRWKPRLAKVWPGPIAGYLLGKLDEETFLGETLSQPVLEARRLCKAHFWVGLKGYGNGDVAKYSQHLNKAVEDNTIEHRAVVLEEEYWLAKAELEIRDVGGHKTQAQPHQD